MTKIKTKTKSWSFKTKISAPREAKEERKVWRKEEGNKESKKNQQGQAIFRYFLAYLGFLSYFEDMNMNL